MNESDTYFIGGITLNRAQIELLKKRQITTSLLEQVARTSSSLAMGNYLRALLASDGDFEETAGPMIDNNHGNVY